jgi:Asp-tRNA(Asn)/Glu-tRNA(Gln) amidotransferase A subunit family amidase
VERIAARSGFAVNKLSASEMARLIAQGELTSEAVVTACLERIEERDSVVRAWAWLDPDLALQQARTRDREPNRGALHGVPIGVKDVIDTVDMPTQMGSPSTMGIGRRPMRLASLWSARPVRSSLARRRHSSLRA